MRLLRIAVPALSVALVASLIGCGRSRGNDAECDRACVEAKADALDAAAVEQRERDAEQQRRDGKALAEEWRLREPIIRRTLADAKRLGPKSMAWVTYLKTARANLDHFRGSDVARRQPWIELDALATATQLEVEGLKPAKPRPPPADESRSVILARYGCGTGAMVVQINGWDPCFSPAVGALELCVPGDDEDRALIELAALGCARVASSRATATERASIDVCCPPPP